MGTMLGHIYYRSSSHPDIPVPDRGGRRMLDVSLFKEGSMFLTSCEISKVENGFIVNTNYRLTDEEFKLAKEQVKNEGDCYCVDRYQHSSMVFTTLAEVTAFLEGQWKQ